MIVSIGTDLLEVGRIERTLAKHGERFKRRVFTARERAYCDRYATSAERYATRFAAKEATMKMLGTGLAKGVSWQHIEVAREPGEAPRLVLTGRAAEIAAEKGIARTHVSLTHTATHAVAFVVGEALP